MKVLITGGSEGIGFAFACYYARQNASIILVAKNKEKLFTAREILLEKHSCKVDCYAVDLSVTGSGKQVYDLVNGNSVDVLINCAGFGNSGKAELADLEKDEKMVTVNDITPMTLTKLFVRNHTCGLVINVCSTGAFQPGPYIATYYASKSFLLNYTKAVALEKKNSDLKIVALCPGPVKTSFYEKSGGVMSSFHEMPDEVVSYCMTHLYQTVIIPGWYNRLALLLPSGLRTKMLLKIKKRDSK